MAHPETEWLFVASRNELYQKGVIVVKGADRPIAVFSHKGGVAAVDNRCPHLGFPLHRGSVRDGILTCHWHHARFDLCSGCTFDLFADDVPVFEIQFRGNDVYVASRPKHAESRERYFRRLREGMEQNISLIQAKSIVGLLKSGEDFRAIVREIALFGVKNRDGWSSGLTILTAMANLVPLVGEDAAYLALTQGARRVSDDCVGQPPRRDRYPLETEAHPIAVLDGWFTNWITVRQRDAAERTLLTAIGGGVQRLLSANPEPDTFRKSTLKFEQDRLVELVMGAATERFYADGGHALDFFNKAFELLELIGWEYASDVLPSVVRQLAAARGGEEMNAWRHPVDLVQAIRALEDELPQLLHDAMGEFPEEGTWQEVTDLSEMMLGDDPLLILRQIKWAITVGASPSQLSQALVYAAALRILRFGPSNEFGDWITALHTFTYANALDQAIRRSPRPRLVRGVLHGAMSVYLDRFLNVPPARLPDPSEVTAEGPALLGEFLSLLDTRSDLQASVLPIVRYLKAGHPDGPLFDALTLATVREDAEFHTFQMVEAAIRQYVLWRERDPESAEAPDFLLAAARYLAAHAPTQRAQLQTAHIAMRLHRGESLHDEE